MSNNNLNEIGEQFKSAVSDALSTGDFDHLNGLVRDTVNSAIEEARNQAGIGREQWRDDLQRTRSKFAQEQHKASNITNDYVHGRQTAGQNRGYAPRTSQQARGTSSVNGQQRSKYDFRRMPGETPNTGGQGGRAGQGGQGGAGGQPGQPGGYAARPRQPLAENRNRVPVVFRKVGSVSGTVLQIIGSVGIGGLGIASFVMLILLAATRDMVLFFVLLLLLGLLGGSIGMVLGGANLKSRLARATQYFELFGKNKYMNISELELHTGKSRKFLVKDLKKIIKSGIFPQGHLDLKEECVMLDNATYEQYLALEKQRVQLQLSETQKKQIAQTPPGDERSEADRQLDEMIREGHEYIRQIREHNDRIKGEVISEKLFHLEDLLKEIFGRLSEHPEQMPKMHKVMSYYLPTTMKLVSAYAEFDQVSEQGENIIAAKAEIENTIDTINDAFSELLNNLFMDAAFDAATDAQVLKSMLAREGLTKEPEFAFAAGPQERDDLNREKMTFEGFDEE